ncbi:cell shape determination protein CcmA, partial [Xanthomonas vesicatoria]
RGQADFGWGEDTGKPTSTSKTTVSGDNDATT